MENEALREFDPAEEGTLPIGEEAPPEGGRSPFAAEEEVSAEEAAAEEEATAEEAGESEAYGEDAYAALAAADLAALRASAPSLALPGDLRELSDPGRYGALREAGLSPLEAYLATEGQRLLARQKDSRAHLAPSVTRTAARGGGRIATGDLLAARDLFPSLSDGEIEALWRRAKSVH